MPHLRLVDKSPPTAKQAAIERVKALPNERQELQCTRCGCRTYLMIYNGGTLLDGRLKHGTSIDRCVCANCYKKGINQSMMPPDLKRI